jgi:hypothetical protein
MRTCPGAGELDPKAETIAAFFEVMEIRPIGSIEVGTS